MRLGDLAVGVLQHVGEGAVEHAGPAQARIGEARRVAAGGDPLAARLSLNSFTRTMNSYGICTILFSHIR